MRLRIFSSRRRRVGSRFPVPPREIRRDESFAERANDSRSSMRERCLLIRVIIGVRSLRSPCRR